VSSTVRVALPSHLRTLAGTGAEVGVVVPDAPTIADVLDALEAAHPALRGTIRDQRTGARRAYIRYFACGRDLSHEGPDVALPGAVVAGDEPFTVIGAISGG
jgi:sulfur-carrier protein